jgi:hypothetical protein
VIIYADYHPAVGLQDAFLNQLTSSLPKGDCCKTPRSRHSSQHYRSLLSVSEDNVGETKRRNRYFATVPKGSDLIVFHEGLYGDVIKKELPTCTILIYPLEKKFRQQLQNLKPKLKEAILNTIQTPKMEDKNIKKFKDTLNNMSFDDLISFLQSSTEPPLIKIFKWYFEVAWSYGSKKSVFERNLEWGNSVYKVMKSLDRDNIQTPILVIGGAAHFDKETFRGAFLTEAGWNVEEKIEMVAPMNLVNGPTAQLDLLEKSELAKVNQYYHKICS